jgi:alkylation response protein AidB-like acyl-CoA dehydrogenase
MSDQALFPIINEWLSDMDRSLAENLRRWADNELQAKRLEHKEDYDNLLLPAITKLFTDIGMQRLFWPEAHGGDGHNSPEAALTMVRALEEIARGDTSIAMLLSQVWALQGAIAMEGAVNDQVCEGLAPFFNSGQEPALVSLILPLYGNEPQASAKLSKGQWIIEAENARPSACGCDAAVFGVLCSMGESDDDLGVIAVPGAAKGIRRGDRFLKTGLAADRNANVSFAKVKVSENGCVARGREACRGLLSWLYLDIAASTIGALFATYEILKEWGDSRVIKGKGQVFKNNPLTASVMGEVAKEISLSRMLTYDLAHILSQPSIYGEPGEEANFVTASMVAHHVCQAAEKAINNAMEMMASAGYATEWNLERYWRDVKTLQLCLGPYELSKMVTAGYFYQSLAR